MSDHAEIEMLKEIKKVATEKLSSLKPTLEGLLLEMKSGQRRNFDSSDFIINEFRQLVRSLDDLTSQLKRLP